MGRPAPGRCAPMRGRSSSMPLATPIAGSTNFCPIQLQTLESLALREGKTDRSIRMTLSLAFLAPNIVKAAVDGRLAARIRSQASCRPSDGLARPMAGARARGAGARISTTDRLALCRDRQFDALLRRAVGSSETTSRKQQPWKRKFAARDFGRDAPRKVL